MLSFQRCSIYLIFGMEQIRFRLLIAPLKLYTQKCIRGSRWHRKDLYKYFLQQAIQVCICIVAEWGLFVGIFYSHISCAKTGVKLLKVDSLAFFANSFLSGFASFVNILDCLMNRIFVVDVYDRFAVSATLSQ